MINCPTITSPMWGALMSKTDLQTAYSLYMGEGDRVLHIGDKTNNILIDNLNKEFNLIEAVPNKGTVPTLRYREFTPAAKEALVSQINENYVGDFEIISPESNSKGIQIEGYPVHKNLNYGQEIAKLRDNGYLPPKINKSSVYEQRPEQIRFYNLEQGRHLYENYNLLNNKGEIKTVPYSTVEQKRETNRWVNSLNKSPNYHFEVRKTTAGHKILITDRQSQIEFQRLETAQQRLERNYDVGIVTKKTGEIRKIAIKDKNRQEESRAIGILTLRDSTEYPGYKSIQIANVDKEYQNRGIATDMFRLLLDNIKGDYKGVVSLKESRVNDVEVPAIFGKLAKEYDFRELPNGDTLISIYPSLESFNENSHVDTSIIDRVETESILNTERRQEINKQKEFLLKVFPQVEQVIEDYKMHNLGQLESNGTIVRINPDKMKNDTLFHEFGHLLIDLIGGLSNNTIKEARESLRGSASEQKVLRLYPDLVGTERFDKEVIATALGEDTASVWADSEKQTTWEKILNKILDSIRGLLGIPKNTIRQLSKEILKGKPINLDKYTNKASQYIQEQRDKIQYTDANSIIEAVKDISNKVEFNADTHEYFLEGERLSAVSEIMNEAGYGITPGQETPAVLRGQKLGTTIHVNAEGISNGVQDVIKVDTGFELTKKAHEDLKNILNTLFGDKYTLLNEVIVADPDAGIAGTIDVLAVDENNNVLIFDFKTKDATKGFQYYDSTRFGKSQRSINTLQQSLYSRILKRQLGIDVKDINIVALNAEISKFDKITGISLDNKISKTGVIELEYTPVANKLINNRIKSREQESVGEDPISIEDINENSIEFKNKILLDETLDKYQRIYQESVDVFRAKLRDAKNKDKVAEISKLEEVLRRMVELDTDPKKGIAVFVSESVNQINSLFNLYKERQKLVEQGGENVWTPERLVWMYETMEAYSNLQEISDLLLEESPGIPNSQIERYRRLINDAVSKQNLLQNLYKDIGIKVLSERFYSNITRVVKEIEEQQIKEWKEDNKDKKSTMSVKERDKAAVEYAKKYIDENYIPIMEHTKLRFEQELRIAQEDIGYMARWMDTLLNTNDMVTAAMVKEFVVQYEKSRLNVIEMRQEMIPLLRELESFMKYGPGMPVEKLYDFMLEKNDKGELTGNLLTKYNSDLVEVENAMMERTAHLPAGERKKVRNDWRKENGIKNDWKSFNSDWYDYGQKLVDEGRLTEEEFKDFKYNEDNFRYRRNLTDVINHEAANLLIRWKLDNLGNYRQVTNDKWINKGWKELEEILKNESDPRAKFYNFIIKLSEEADAMLPDKSKLHYTLPAISNGTVQAVQAGKKFTDILKDEYKKKFLYHTDDTDRGNIADSEHSPIAFIPTFYKRSGKFDLSDQSYDIASIYFNYFKMASDYSHRKEILGEMQLSKKLIEDRKYVVRDHKGNPIKKVLDNVREKELTKKGQTSLLAAQVDDWFKTFMYGQRSVSMGSFDVLGIEFDTAKVIDWFSGYSAINMLGTNFVQGFANVTLGELHQLTEAVGAQYFDIKDLAKATAFYMNPKHLGETLGDIGSRSPQGLINLLNEKWDITNEYEGGIYRKSNKFSQLMSTNTLFFTSQMGEHYMQTRTMLAMLAKVEAKNDKGEVIGNMRDMYKSENGKLVLDKRVNLEKSNWTDREQILFGQKTKRILARLHGEYSELGRIAIQRHSLGRAALMFRKFIYPGWDKRYGKLKYNEFLEDHTEGSYRQFGRFFKNVYKDLGTLKLALVQEKFQDLLPRERANIVRAFTELSFALGMMFLGGMFTRMVGDADDENEKWRNAFLAYQAKRTRSELLFFMSPTDALNILVSPAASISTLQSWMGLIGQMTFGPFDKYEAGTWKDDYKMKKRAIKVSPVIRQWYRLTDIEDYIHLFDAY